MTYKLYHEHFDIDDRLGVNKPPVCGWTDCTQLPEPGYGRCQKHLNCKHVWKPSMGADYEGNTTFFGECIKCGETDADT